MQKIISHNGNEINFSVKKHHAARRIKLSVLPNAKVIITIPKRSSYKIGKDFLTSNLDWVTKTLNENSAKFPVAPHLTFEKFKKSKSHYHRILKERLDQLNLAYQFTYKNIVIRDQRTRWGSCTSKGTLNFNYKIFDLAPEVMDYILVHELCHLKEMNHSWRFWALVAKQVPNYKILRIRLGKNSLS